MLEAELLSNALLQIVLIGFILSLFIFPEFSDLIGERIEHFKRTDFYPAMRACGIKESRIINVEILIGNSLPHIFHKLVSVFGISVFLLCSIDFIISVGLSTEVSLINFQITLGSLLAKMDSKQDILAISHLFSDPSYFPNLLFRHLQGISTGFIIVFTLICIYKISNGLIKRLP
jgi:ABC-type dipeptide/oligopeptide/nickel transport system permease subunit